MSVVRLLTGDVTNDVTVAQETGAAGCSYGPKADIHTWTSGRLLGWTLHGRMDRPQSCSGF